MSGLGVGLLIGGIVLVALVAALWVSRSQTLERRVGSFRCARGRTAAGPWSAGTAQYGARRLYWWRRWSLSPRPGSRWERSELAVVERVRAEDGVHVVVTCRAGESLFFLQMSPEAYAGLTSWIEATPSRVGSVI